MENHGLLAHIVWAGMQIDQIQDSIQDSFRKRWGY